MNAADLFRDRLKDLVARHLSWPIGPRLDRAQIAALLRAEALRVETTKQEPPSKPSQYPKL